jgi:hypothetical protein
LWNSIFANGFHWRACAPARQACARRMQTEHVDRRIEQCPRTEEAVREGVRWYRHDFCPSNQSP